MTKGSCKQKTKSVKEDPGCLWGFIRMLKFRRKTLKMLLSDGNSRSVSGNKGSPERCQLTSSYEEKQETASIKSLVEKEMSTVYHSNRTQRADSEHLRRTPNSREIEILDSRSSDSKSPTNLVPRQSQFQNILEALSGDVNLSTALQKFYDDRHKNQSSSRAADCEGFGLLQNLLVLQKTLHEALEPLYKFFNITSNGMLGQSDEFLKILEVMGSDRDVFLNCLRDPNSFPLKHNQNPPPLDKQQSSKAVNGDQEKECPAERIMPHRQSIVDILRRKQKADGQDMSCGGDQNSSQTSLDKTVVLLKPKTTRKESVMMRCNSPNSSPRSPECLRDTMENEKVSYGFSLREIRKRLRDAIRDGRRRRDDHLVTLGSRLEVASKSSCSSEGSSSQLATTGDDKRKRHGLPNSSSSSLGYSNNLLREVYMEGFDDDNGSSACRTPSTDERSKSPCSLESRTMETPSEEASGTKDVMIAGDSDLVRMVNSSGFRRSEGREDDDSASTSRSEEEEEEETAEENVIEKPTKHGSPVSVLEPPFSDEATGPVMADTGKDVLRVSPRKLDFGEYDDVPAHPHLGTSSSTEIKQVTTCTEEEEFKRQYIVCLLEASGLSSSRETWGGYNLEFSHQLLDPALYDEVETPNGDAPDNLKLLFDSINEVLVNIQRRYFGCILGVPSFLLAFPSMEDVVEEISRHTRCVVFSLAEKPNTFRQILKSHIHGSGWLTTTARETEDITNSIGVVILEEILQEMVREMWY